MSQTNSQPPHIFTAQVEKPKDIGGGEPTGEAQELQRWKAEVERAEKYYGDFFDRCDKITARYRVEEKAAKARGGTRRYNVLWSLVNTMQPNLYIKMPKPYVSRRYRDKDPIARAASMILERCLIYVNDSDEMHDAMSAAVDDHILSARGQIWTRYKPEFDLRLSETKNYLNANDKLEIPEDAELGEDENGKYYREQIPHVTYEECETDHIQVRNFIHAPCSSWKAVPWVGKKVLMTRTELEKRFGKRGKTLPLNYTTEGTRFNKESKPEEVQGLFKCALVYEVWDKETKRVRWFSLDSQDGFLDQKDDPLQLKNFFPCPRPLYGTLTNNSLTPVPDYKYYEDVAGELDELTFRISLITESIRVAGVYDAQLGEMMQKLTKGARENELIPIENWQQFAEAGGFKGAVAFLPIQELIQVLEKLYFARQQLIAELYEITGISDIVRGNSDPRETAAAQRIKGDFAGKRLKRRQRMVARFAREHLEIQTEIICRHYDDEMIARISSADQFVTDAAGNFDQKLFAAAIALLRDNPLRHFRIKIDNETLAAEEIEGDREQGMQFIQSLSQLLGQAIPLAKEAPAIGKLVKEVTLFGMRLFPIGRSVEAAMEMALEELANTPPPQEAAPAKMTAEEIALKHKELDIKQQELGLKRQELALQERLELQKLKMEEKRADQEFEIRKIDQQRQAAAKVAEIEQKDRQADKDRSQETFQNTLDRVEADKDRQEARAGAEADRRERLMGKAADLEAGERSRMDAKDNENRRAELEEHRHASDVANRSLDRESASEQNEKQLAAKAEDRKAAAAAKRKAAA